MPVPLQSKHNPLGTVPRSASLKGSRCRIRTWHWAFRSKRETPRRLDLALADERCFEMDLGASLSCRGACSIGSEGAEAAARRGRIGREGRHVAAVLFGKACGGGRGLWGVRGRRREVGAGGPVGTRADGRERCRRCIGRLQSLLTWGWLWGDQRGGRGVSGWRQCAAVEHAHAEGAADLEGAAHPVRASARRAGYLAS